MWTGASGCLLAGLCAVSLQGASGFAFGCNRSSDPAPAPGQDSGSLSATVGSAGPSGAVTRAPPAARPSARPAPVGGEWLRCYASFQPRTDPKSDVQRLGALCGPPNGMQRLLDAREGELEDSGLLREHRFNARSGDCFRIFAVGAPSIEDLDVEVFGPSGRRLALDTGDDRWPVVQPDGPFCAFEAGEHLARVLVQRGFGRYAIEIWKLP